MLMSGQNYSAWVRNVPKEIDLISPRLERGGTIDVDSFVFHIVVDYRHVAVAVPGLHLGDN